MNQEINQQFPATYRQINDATKASGFDMASDVLTCSLLRTLATSKPSGNFLELGTGTGLSTSWILDGMDESSTLTSIDNNEKFLSIAKDSLGNDSRLNIVSTDGGDWIEKNKDKKFDYIFADTWHGKYLLLNEALSMLKKGGFYIIDDMLPQSNWPDGHAEKAIKLMVDLESNKDLRLTKQLWATGIVIGVKK
ncbi:O-methyltransferase [Pedobacter rhodius]|uniref:Class I SAM-dependent methyltransferase n=1 Tax=Pedobacter rhodius TaxID=3004098 RepID=A0ABT4KU26_9SPHI|nr:class I SAM-dependent methyltransferase [Pedobacter sp. SJ11]MCZ4221732.1 class I SAM-dependent methyltransferase [Pedobacter sp. SJ11]